MLDENPLYYLLGDPLGMKPSSIAWTALGMLLLQLQAVGTVKASIKVPLDFGGKMEDHVQTHSWTTLADEQDRLCGHIQLGV